MAASNGYKASPAPVPGDFKFMSKQGWDTLFAFIDAAMPSVVAASQVTDPKNQIVVPDAELDKKMDAVLDAFKEPPPRERVVEFLKTRAVEDEGFRNDCMGTLASAPQRYELGKLMDFIGTHAGSLLFTGSWTPPAGQTIKSREQVLKSWSSSKFTLLRVLLKSINSISQKAMACTTPYLAELTGYSDMPRKWERKTGYDFKFIQVEDGKGPYQMKTDVVIVGSGCGGGVSAKNLAEAGHKVVVVDKGYHFNPEQLPLPQGSGGKYLYDNAGLYLTDSSSANIVAGSTWGGGGTINWSVCLKLQDYVRKEWAAAGLPFFASKEYDECIDRVWQAVGASNDAIRHNFQNNVVLNGSKKLGWQSKVCDQNTGSVEHYCGQCHLGCGSNEKRGPAVAFLPDAAAAGAEFMEGFTVEKIRFAADGVTATGVEGTWTARDADGNIHTDASLRRQRKVIINAKKVVVSAGSMWSPVLLSKSGVDNYNVGRHLHIHPCNIITALFKGQEPQWEGGIITSYSGEFQNLDRKGHGIKIETLCMVPYAAYTVQPFRNGVDSKLVTPRYRNLGGFISITRDRDTGRVYPDHRSGTPRIDYTTSDFDAEHTMDGLEAIAKLCYVMGATEIQPGLPNIEPFVVARDGDPELQRNYKDGQDPEFTDAKFAKWLRTLRKVGNAGPDATWLSAHQMGSCRMSAKAADGVVDPRGSVWGTKNLYVADASVFPSASGVNPMITALSIADYISRNVAQDLVSKA